MAAENNFGIEANDRLQKENQSAPPQTSFRNEYKIAYRGKTPYTSTYRW